MAHILCHITLNTNASHGHWTIVFIRQVAEINWPIKFNDKRIMKTGYRNPTRNKEEKYQLTTVFCGWNLTEWWVIFFPFLISHSTSNFKRQSGIQFLLLNPSFKGWRPWKSWSIVTVFFSPYPLNKKSLQAPDLEALPWNYPSFSSVSFSLKNLFTEHLRHKWLAEKHTWESCIERDCICSGMPLAFTAIC